ncbi:hypothetical protein BB561_000051 [Smittium simulii]|uniref:Ubiquitin-like domain-containing protein n=1 Tax=Smittium simulii TaxID=133385 RepID=A0A2T9Z0Y2_9FUNG|nr:hypothetical protein BB561_000051 [Smittium simulii]
MNETKNHIVTIRVIKNFEYRTVKNIVLRVNLDTLTIKDNAAFKPYRNVTYDTLKIHAHAFGTKTQNLIINFGEDGFLDNDELTLTEAGVLHETDISFFNIKAYKEYEKNPQMKW